MERVKKQKDDRTGAFPAGFVCVFYPCFRLKFFVLLGLSSPLIPPWGGMCANFVNSKLRAVESFHNETHVLSRRQLNKEKFNFSYPSYPDLKRKD